MCVCVCVCRGTLFHSSWMFCIDATSFCKFILNNAPKLAYTNFGVFLTTRVTQKAVATSGCIIYSQFDCFGFLFVTQYYFSTIFIVIMCFKLINSFIVNCI